MAATRVAPAIFAERKIYQSIVQMISIMLKLLALVLLIVAGSTTVRSQLQTGLCGQGAEETSCTEVDDGSYCHASDDSLSTSICDEPV